MSQVKCAWCEAEGAKYHPIMSKDNPACSVCFEIWYQEGHDIKPEQLRDRSLEKQGRPLKR